MAGPPPPPPAARVQMALDENNDRVFTEQELLGAAKKVFEMLKRQGTAGGAGMAPEALAVLDKMSRLIRSNMVGGRMMVIQLAV